jgi:hypothetical protein
MGSKVGHHGYKLPIELFTHHSMPVIEFGFWISFRIAEVWYTLSFHRQERCWWLYMLREGIQTGAVATKQELTHYTVTSVPMYIYFPNRNLEVTV